MVGGDGLDRAAKGLDLVQGSAVGIESVRPTTHTQAVQYRLQADLGLVCRPASLRHALMAQPPLLGARRRREAQIEVAALGRKRAQIAHRYGVQRCGVAIARGKPVRQDGTAVFGLPAHAASDSVHRLFLQQDLVTFALVACCAD